MTRELRRSRVLVVEDEYILACELQQHLEGAGAEVVGPAATVDAALSLLAVHAVDRAIVDIRLGRDMAYPVADELRARGIPFVFFTGYEPEAIPSAYADVFRGDKPLNFNELTRALFA
ncbi:hypothetical protein GCM10007276_33500 [Agaricicola taiwanensis]|uniref:Response regulatory domain-containing protein n=1 Tax=Agaricicola taiwanensis TaxID=591372 RepID=A0A8J2YMU9_9RHOB|nr:response regulator [Agaricicola taiwanensis]GGE53742.1 hypothetical protein GCM10007276_33500 [Agaricicola taiwanensis]